MAAFAKSWRFTRMFRFFSGPRRAQQIAYSIGQLIHMLSAGRENHGLESPERLLRGLGPFVNEDTISGQRVITLLIPMTTEVDFFVKLATTPDSRHTLMIEGRDAYAGFTLSCGLPPRAVMIDLRPGAFSKVTRQARLLYAACKTMPNAVEGRDFSMI